MSEPAAQDRIRPSLLERLTDEAPDVRVEPPDRRRMSLQRLRESVLRDISWLMNTVSLDSAEDLSGYPRVAASVVNFGVPEFSGAVLASLDEPALEERVRAALLRFEPRIIPESLRVRCVADKHSMDIHSLAFEVVADIQAVPTPMPLYLRTLVDVESGEVVVSEEQG